MAKEKYTMNTESMYKCIKRPGANPCIFDSRYDSDYADGTVRGKVIRINRYVKFGNTTRWVDPAARKHFEPLNEAARKQDKADYDKLFKHLKGLGVKVPDDATLSELGSHYDKLDKRLKIDPIRTRVKPSRKFELEDQEELTNAQLKEKITEKGGTYPTVVNKAQLKEILASL